MEDLIKEVLQNSTVKEVHKDAEKARSFAMRNSSNENMMSYARELLSFGAARAAVKNGFVDEIETNANEVMHTTNTGYGAELIPDQVLLNEALSLVPNYSRLVAALPSFHGYNMPKSLDVPILGEIGTFKVNSEWTTGAPTVAQATHRQATGEINITQAPLISNIGISKRELNYSVVNLEERIRQNIAKDAAGTLDTMIINGDSETGATGNVNSDDQAPGTTYGTDDCRIAIDHGIRELAINGTALTINVGTFDWDDLVNTMALLGDFAADPSQLLWIFNQATYMAAMKVAEFKKANENGRNSVIFTGNLSNILGADLHVNRYMPKTEADGKMSATASNNTLGQFGCIHRPSIQYGYGQNLEIDVVKVPGKGIELVATMEFGFAIAQLKAGQANSSVALGRNVTL